MKKAGRGMVCCLIMTVGLMGCLKHEGVDFPKNAAGVSIYQSSPDAPEVNFLVDGKIMNATGLKYKNYTNYIDVDAGDRSIKFNVNGTGANVADTTFQFETGLFYSVFLMNTAAKGQILKTQDVSDFPASGKAMIRFIHLAPDAPPVNINWKGETTLLFSGKEFKSVSAFQEVTAGTFTMEVKEIGGSNTIVSVTNVQIKEGGFFTILLEGFDTPPANNTNKLSARVVTN